MSETFRIRVMCDEELSLEEIWPDGDAPPNPTAADVARAMKDSTTAVWFVRDWNMPIEVTVDGELVVW